MKRISLSNVSRLSWAISLMILLLAGCEGNSSPPIIQTPIEQAPVEQVPAEVEMITISGRLSALVPTGENGTGSFNARAVHVAGSDIEDWSGATITVTNAGGEQATTGTADSEGNFEVALAPNTHYFFRVTIGNLLLMYYLPPASESQIIDVNPRSTAEMMILIAVTELELGLIGVVSTQSPEEISALLDNTDENATISLSKSVEDNIVSDYDESSTKQSTGGAARVDRLQAGVLAAQQKDLPIHQFSIDIVGNGSVDAPLGFMVAEEATVTLFFTPDDCFEFADVKPSPDTLFDESKTGLSTTNQFSASYFVITEDTIITVFFIRTRYRIDTSIEGNGSLSPNILVSPECGIPYSYTIKPDSGSVIVDVIVNGGSVGPVSSYTFPDITNPIPPNGQASHTIHAIFAPAPQKPTISFNDGTRQQVLGTAVNHTFEVDAGSLNGGASTITLSYDRLVVVLESFFAALAGQSPTGANVPRAQFSANGSSATSASDIGIPITDGIRFDETPITPFVVTAVTSCLTEGVTKLTASIADASGTELATDSIDIECTRPATSAACQSATTGLEKAHECNNDLVGVLPIDDIFVSTVVDVPIGGGAGRTLPGGTTIHLPLTLSGSIPDEADFSANGWNGSLLPPSSPIPAMFGLDATHQYMFIQYEAGVDLIDLSTPDAEPVFNGLLNYPGRAQASEFNNSDDFSKLHDYFVMPVHGINEDYLIGCGTDVVRHDFDPAAHNGAGAFVANAERISNGFELCRDIWTQSNVDGIAPGYAYTTKSVSKSQKTSRWLEDGFAEVTLGGDWTTQGIDINNRIMGGAGGFMGEHTLLGSRGISEMGLWSGIPGDAVEGSVAPRISMAAFFQDVRCVGTLCIATASDTITTLLWPDRNAKPTVHKDNFIAALGLTARSMIVAANGNIYLLGMANKRVAIGRVTSAGDFGGTIEFDVSSVCTDPQSVQVMDMEHLGIMCRTDNQFKVLEFLPDL